MTLISCANCSYNGLQADGFGARVGYCTSHKQVLHQSQRLTCGRLLRRDLLLPEARTERAIHADQFSPAKISIIGDRAASAARLNLIDSDTSEIVKQQVGRPVIDFAAGNDASGGSKAMFLSQLAAIARSGDGRAELAQHSLGRVYVSNCVQRDGARAWTSGIHLLQWTKELLPIEPTVTMDDFADSALPASRQSELARWDILFFRLTFLSDMGHLAPNNDAVAGLRTLPERAARATGDVNFSALMKWVSSTAWKIAEAAFPTARYQELHTRLHHPRRDIH